MTPEAREELVAYWRFVEGRGRRPRAVNAIAHVRSLGLKVRDSEAYGILQHFRQLPVEKPAETGQSISLTRAENGTDSGRGRAAASRAQIGITSYQEDSLRESPPALLEVPSPRPARLPLPRTDRRKPAEIVADTALAALRAEVEPHLAGSAWSCRRSGAAPGWIERNRRYAVAIAEAGRTAEEIVDAYYDLAERRATNVLEMRWVQEDLDRGPRRDPHAVTPDVPRYRDLEARGEFVAVDARIAARNAAARTVRPVRPNQHMIGVLRGMGVPFAVAGGA